MTDKIVKRSRWASDNTRKVYGSLKFPARYSETETTAIVRKYHEPVGWSKGARVRRAR
jgi:hypothetical protein